jgi:two-component system chemotaxis response regulator CheY
LENFQPMFDFKTRILIVDDMITMRKLVVKSCKEIGFNDLTEAGDGIEGWAAIQEANPSFGLILSDCNMPNSTGLDLLKRVRADSRFGKTPFILVTSDSEESQIVLAAKAGVSEYVVKPFTAEFLRERIEVVHQKMLKK